MNIKQEESKELNLRLRRIFAKNLKVARAEAQMSQGQLAKRSGLTQPFLSDVENAKTTITLDRANSLATALGLPLSRLLSYVEDKDHPSIIALRNPSFPREK